MKEYDIIKDRYQLLRPLGSGGFGEVWLAKDMKTHTHCALKFYVRLDDKGREEFSSEYSRMLGIRHPNLLTASYYDEWQGRPFLVMDYCGGGAASGKVGQLDETELWRLIRDVASGLACLHSQRDEQGKEAPVIHQDIKPANFLQKGDGTWLISDFGISSRMRSSMSSQSGREVNSGGTIPYMGPERFGQGKMLVKSSDIWALGASIYEMVTKDLPFDEYGGILQKKGEEIPHLPRERWSSDLDRLVSSCLQKETWDRPSAALVAEYADCKLKGKPLPSLPHEAPPPPPPPPKRWKWMAAAGAVVAVVLAIKLWPKPSIDQPDYINSKAMQLLKANLEQTKQQTPTSSSTDTSSPSYTMDTKDHEWVDLGLPSGTLWATCNIGASRPEEYGNYYAWGETRPKSKYSWDTYKYANGGYDKLTKYCNNSNFGNNGFTDNLTALQSEDDAATTNWGSSWHIPSRAQWEELRDNTIQHWTKRGGKNGMLFTSKTNGQVLFLPAADSFEQNNVGILGHYWSREFNANNSYSSWSLHFGWKACTVYDGYWRYFGFSVRPVREK